MMNNYPTEEETLQEMAERLDAEWLKAQTKHDRAKRMWRIKYWFGCAAALLAAFLTGVLVG